MHGFDYPTEPHVRRHGPSGYLDYESYREWLRDEFLFRCVYCLHRERWDSRGAAFNIEHFHPVSADPSGDVSYSNLLYSCQTCNNAKRNILGIPDPCMVAFGNCVRIAESGEIESLNELGARLIEKLRLNNRKTIEFRHRWIRLLKTLEQMQPELYREFMAFPTDLPDLRKKRVAENSRPEGAENCYFALRERGELPETY